MGPTRVSWRSPISASPSPDTISCSSTPSICACGALILVVSSIFATASESSAASAISSMMAPCSDLCGRSDDTSLATSGYRSPSSVARCGAISCRSSCDGIKLWRGPVMPIAENIAENIEWLSTSFNKPSATPDCFLLVT